MQAIPYPTMPWLRHVDEKVARAPASGKPHAFGEALMGRVMSWAAGIALVLVTLWILTTGYRVLTGQSFIPSSGCTPLMVIVTHMTRVVVIVTVATSMTIFSTPLHTFLTKSLSDEINHVVTNSDDSVTSSIDKNLAYTEIAMSAIDAVQLVHGADDEINQKNHADFFSGTAGPP